MSPPPVPPVSCQRLDDSVHDLDACGATGSLRVPGNKQSFEEPTCRHLMPAV
jgi:hypothetical protein